MEKWQTEREIEDDDKKKEQKSAEAISKLKNIYISSNTDNFYSTMGCFRCESWNGSNPECEDTFNSTAAFLKGFYEQNCMSYMKSRNGLYPATACVKIKGKISKFLKYKNSNSVK